MQLSTLVSVACAAVLAIIPAVEGAPPRTPSIRTIMERQDSTEAVIVYVGTLFSDTYQYTLDAILDTQTNILLTEEQIGFMADRIVYVTELSQTGAIEIISLVVGLILVGMEDGLYQYMTVLMPVMALPAGWLEGC